jgi:hypothetical protein
VLNLVSHITGKLETVAIVNKVLRKVYEYVPKSEGYEQARGDSVTGSCMICTSYRYYSVDQIKEDEVDMATGHGWGEERDMQSFIGKT